MSWTEQMERPRQAARIDLFPFLSLFLCILGLMAFLALLLSVTGKGMAELVVEQSGASEASELPGKAEKPDESGLSERRTSTAIEPVPAKASCGETGFSLRLPESSTLGPLIADLPFDARVRVEAVRKSREAQATVVFAIQDGDLGPLKAALTGPLEEMAMVNAAAREAGSSYEEFLLLGVEPGGGDCYHAVMGVLRERTLGTVRIGAIPLDSNWVAEIR